MTRILARRTLLLALLALGCAPATAQPTLPPPTSAARQTSKAEPEPEPPEPSEPEPEPPEPPDWQVEERDDGLLIKTRYGIDGIAVIPDGVLFSHGNAIGA